MKTVPASTLCGEVDGENGLVYNKRVGVGLVTPDDIATSTLTLETRRGCQRAFVAPTAASRDAHDRALALGDIDPWGAVAHGLQPSQGQDDLARALMPGTGLTTTWPDLGCPAATVSDEGRSHR